MLFFQVLLLAGYAYAHWLREAAPAARQAIDPHACCSSRPRHPAHRAGRRLEADGRRGADRAHPAAALRHGRAAVLPARLDQPAAAGLVRARAARRATRTASSPSPTSPRCCALVGYPFVVEPFLTAREQVRRLVAGCSPPSRCSARASPGARLAARPSTRSRRGRDEPSPNSDYVLLARAVGHRLGAAARGHQPPHAERRLGAAAVARAAHALPADLHPRFRGPGLVPAASALAAGARRARRHGLAAGRRELPLSTCALQLGVFLPGLFIGCMFCHGELYRLRPAPRTSPPSTCRCRPAARSAACSWRWSRRSLRGYYELGVALVGPARCSRRCVFERRPAWRAARASRVLHGRAPPARPTTASTTSEDVRVRRAASTACCA